MDIPSLKYARGACGGMFTRGVLSSMSGVLVRRMSSMLAVCWSGCGRVFTCRPYICIMCRHRGCHLCWPRTEAVLWLFVLPNYNGRHNGPSSLARTKHHHLENSAQ